MSDLPPTRRERGTLLGKVGRAAELLAILDAEDTTPAIVRKPWDFRGDPLEERPARLPADSWQRRLSRPRQRAQCGHGGPAHAKGLCRECYRAVRYSKTTVEEREESWAKSEEHRREKVRARLGLPFDADDATVRTTANRLGALKRWRTVKAEAIKRARRADRYVNTGSINGWEEIKSPLPSRGYQGVD